MAIKVQEEATSDVLVAVPGRNGTHPSPTGPVMPRRTTTIPMPSEYGDAGMTLTIWVNYPNRLGQDLFANNDERVDATFQEYLQAWLDKPETGGDTLNGDRKVRGIRLRDQRKEAARLFRESEWPKIRDKIKEDLRYTALGKIVLGHNNWWNPEEERPYPPTTDPEFWIEVSNELVLAIFSCVSLEIGQLSKAVSAERESQT